MLIIVNGSLEQTTEEGETNVSSVGSDFQTQEVVRLCLLSLVNRGQDDFDQDVVTLNASPSLISTGGLKSLLIRFLRTKDISNEYVPDNGEMNNQSPAVMIFDSSESVIDRYKDLLEFQAHQVISRPKKPHKLTWVFQATRK